MGALQLAEEEVEAVLVDVGQHEARRLEAGELAADLAADRARGARDQDPSPAHVGRRLARSRTGRGCGAGGPRAPGPAAWRRSGGPGDRRRRRAGSCSSSFRSAQASSTRLSRSGGRRGMANRSWRTRQRRATSGRSSRDPRTGRPPIVVPRLLGLVVHEADDVVVVLVGSPEVAQQELARAARPHDQRAHPVARPRAQAGGAPGVGQAQREAGDAHERGGEEELDHDHGAGRPDGDVLRRALREEEEAVAKSAVPMSEASTIRTPSWSPESRKDQRWIPNARWRGRRIASSSGRHRRSWSTRGGGMWPSKRRKKAR